MPETKQLILMQKYIGNTKMGACDRYDMRTNEIKAVQILIRSDLWRAITLVYDYGRAKGYRMAMADVRKGMINI